LEKPTRGSITIGERTVSGSGIFVPTYRRRLGMVFQSYAVWPHKTVRENVAFPLRQQGVSRAEQVRRVARVLDQVGLASYGERYPSQLSGGQQQRVSLARALVAEPEVILYDEPLSNLDAKLRDSMRDLLSELHRSIGTTSVYVTHDQSEAMVLSDMIYIMNDGRLEQSGTPEDLYERPKNRFVAEFLGNANTLPVLEFDRGSGQAKLANGAVLRVGRCADEVREKIVIARPHQLRFAQPGLAENALNGTVNSVSYLGDRVRYQIKLDLGESVMVERIGAREAAEGERMSVHFPPEYCIAV
jgi:iron(III) transport system ATP-binding protein